jgi:hypothetical protein
VGVKQGRMKTIVCIVLTLIYVNLCLAKPVEPYNHCQYYASDKDITNAGIYYKIMDYCTKIFGKTPDAVHVNADNYDYKMCLAPGTTQFGNLSPSYGQNIVAQDTYSNQENQTVQHTFSLTGSYGESMSLETTDTVDLSVGVSYSVGIPDVLEATFSISTTFSTSTSETHEKSADASFESSTTIDALPFCTYSAKLVANTMVWHTDMQTPVCLDGFARCQFGSPVQGHYYWYVDVAGFLTPSDLCFVQHGGMAAGISITSNTTISRNCPKPLPGNK